MVQTNVTNAFLNVAHRYKFIQYHNETLDGTTNSEKKKIVSEIDV